MVEGRCYIQLVTVLLLLLLHHNFLLVLCGSFRKFPSGLMWAPPQAMVWISSPTWSSPQATWEYPGVPRAHPPLPLFSDFGVHTALLWFFPLIPLHVRCFQKGATYLAAELSCVLPWGLCRASWRPAWGNSCSPPSSFLAVKTLTSTSDTRGWHQMLR